MTSSKRFTAKNQITYQIKCSVNILRSGFAIHVIGMDARQVSDIHYALKAMLERVPSKSGKKIIVSNL